MNLLLVPVLALPLSAGRKQVRVAPYRLIGANKQAGARVHTHAHTYTHTKASLIQHYLAQRFPNSNRLCTTHLKRYTLKYPPAIFCHINYNKSVNADHRQAVRVPLLGPVLPTGQRWTRAKCQTLRGDRRSQPKGGNFVGFALWITQDSASRKFKAVFWSLGLSTGSGVHRPHGGGVRIGAVT